MRERDCHINGWDKSNLVPPLGIKKICNLLISLLSGFFPPNVCFFPPFPDKQGSLFGWIPNFIARQISYFIRSLYVDWLLYFFFVVSNVVCTLCLFEMWVSVHTPRPRPVLFAASYLKFRFRTLINGTVTCLYTYWLGKCELQFWHIMLSQFAISTGVFTLLLSLSLTISLPFISLFLSPPSTLSHLFKSLPFLTPLVFSLPYNFTHDHPPVSLSLSLTLTVYES